MTRTDKNVAKYDLLGRLVERLYDLPVEELKALLTQVEARRVEIGPDDLERNGARKRCVITVDYVAANRVLSDFTEDISNSGVFVNTTQPFNLGDKIVLAIAFAGDQNPFRIPAEVVRQTDKGVGLKFDYTSQVQRAIVETFVDNLKIR